MEEMRTKFIRTGYPPDIVHVYCERARETVCNILWNTPIPLVTTFGPDSNRVASIVKKTVGHTVGHILDLERGEIFLVYCTCCSYGERGHIRSSSYSKNL